MEQDIKVLRKAKIVKILLAVVIAFNVLSLLASVLAGDFSVLLFPVALITFSIIIIFWINKKNIVGYQTARTWLVVFFTLILMGGNKLPENINTTTLVIFLTILGIFAASALLVNSICKSFKAKLEVAPKQNKVMRIIVIIFFSLFGLLILTGIIATIISYFNGTLNW